MKRALRAAALFLFCIVRMGSAVSDDSSRRLDLVRQWLVKQHLDAALFSSANSLRYLTGFAPSGADPEEAFLVVAPASAEIFTLRFYEQKARRLAPDLPVTTPAFLQKRADALREFFKKKLSGARRVAVEKGHLSLETVELLQKASPGIRFEKAQIVDTLRKRKSPEEVARLREAVEVTRKGLLRLVAKARVGVTEADLLREFKIALLEEGALEAFGTIVAAGPHGAEPHFDEPGRVPLKEGDLVVVDLGARVNGYNADLTRMIVIGTPTPEAAKVLDLVKQAQEAGIAKVAPGVACREVDRAARQIIGEAGYGKAFYHATGHGVGMDVHEAPRVSHDAPPEEKLEPGNVVTVEPGVYLPGKFGVRIEDMILVTEKGHENLTASIPKVFYVK